MPPARTDSAWAQRPCEGFAKHALELGWRGTGAIVLAPNAAAAGKPRLAQTHSPPIAGRKHRDRFFLDSLLHRTLRCLWPAQPASRRVHGDPRSGLVDLLLGRLAEPGRSSVAGPYLEKDIGEHGEHGPYTPAGLREAYGLPSESAGTGQTVGIVDAFDDPNAESDLAKYRSHFGLPPCTAANGCFTKVNQSGGTTYPSPRMPGWAVEISLDLDMVSAACPNCQHPAGRGDRPTATSKICVTAEDEAVALGATELSDSLGRAQSSPTRPKYDSYFHHPGVTDRGRRRRLRRSASAPTRPRRQHVIAVGGTDLERSHKRARDGSEPAWGGEGKGGTGSGCSAYEAQAGLADRHGLYKAGAGPDVAAVAGTSTPVWVAGFGSRLASNLPGYETRPGLDASGSGTSVKQPTDRGRDDRPRERVHPHDRSPGAELRSTREAAQHGDRRSSNDVLSGRTTEPAAHISAKQARAMTGRPASEAPTAPRSYSQPCSRNRRAAGSANPVPRATC